MGPRFPRVLRQVAGDTKALKEADKIVEQDTKEFSGTDMDVQAPVALEPRLDIEEFKRVMGYDPTLTTNMNDPVEVLAKMKMLEYFKKRDMEKGVK